MRGFILKTGLAFQQTNKTGYDESRYMHLVCPVCGTKFNRPPSHVARTKGISTCSVGCAAEARKVRVETHCVICGKSMEQIPSEVERKTTCSKECSTLRRVKDVQSIRPSGFAVYKKRIKELAKDGTCENCGTDTGPWVVRNLKIVLTETGKVSLDESQAKLLCRRCHIEDIAPKGGLWKSKKYGP